MLFIQLLRGVAQGYEFDRDSETGMMQQKIAVVTSGVEWAGALRRDGLVQPDFGMMRGGGIEQEYLGTADYWPPHATPLTIP